jgi:hypothetical protein
MTLTIGTTGRYESATRLLQQYAVQVTPPELGMRQRGNRHDRQRIVWTIPYVYMDETELTTLVNEFTSAKGNAGRINFVAPASGVTVHARFVSNSLQFRCLGPKHYDVTFQVVQDVVI